jgi:hypothetical protein
MPDKTKINKTREQCKAKIASEIDMEKLIKIIEAPQGKEIYKNSKAAVYALFDGEKAEEMYTAAESGAGVFSDEMKNEAIKRIVVLFKEKTPEEKVQWYETNKLKGFMVLIPEFMRTPPPSPPPPSSSSSSSSSSHAAEVNKLMGWANHSMEALDKDLNLLKEQFVTVPLSHVDQKILDDAHKDRDTANALKSEMSSTNDVDQMKNKLTMINELAGKVRKQLVVNNSSTSKSSGTLTPPPPPPPPPSTDAQKKQKIADLMTQGNAAIIKAETAVAEIKKIKPEIGALSGPINELKGHLQAAEKALADAKEKHKTLSEENTKASDTTGTKSVDLDVVIKAMEGLARGLESDATKADETNTVAKALVLKAYIPSELVKATLALETAQRTFNKSKKGRSEKAALHTAQVRHDELESANNAYQLEVEIIKKQQKRIDDQNDIIKENNTELANLAQRTPPGDTTGPTKAIEQAKREIAAATMVEKIARGAIDTMTNYCKNGAASSPQGVMLIERGGALGFDVQVILKSDLASTASVLNDDKKDKPAASAILRTTGEGEGYTMAVPIAGNEVSLSTKSYETAPGVKAAQARVIQSSNGNMDVEFEGEVPAIGREEAAMMAATNCLMNLTAKQWRNGIELDTKNGDRPAVQMLHAALLYKIQELTAARAWGADSPDFSKLKITSSQPGPEIGWTSKTPSKAAQDKFIKENLSELFPSGHKKMPIKGQLQAVIAQGQQEMKTGAALVGRVVEPPSNKGPTR